MKSKIEEELYLTPKQAAEYLNLSLSTIKNYIYAGELKTLKTPGGHHRISKSELLAAMGDIRLTSNTDSLLKERSCAALLMAFNAFGPLSNSLLIHSKTVSEMSYKLSITMGFKEEEALCIKMAGLVHDIGHIGIDKRILLKAGALTPSEYECIKHHPSIGEQILDSIKELKALVSIIVQHHEKLDGSGYPRGLDGDRIQKGARIISVAEAYDAMVSMHSYKSPVSKEMAITELMQQRGSQFDGDAVESFIKILC
jgi:excisionase family DNA binding protein/putative nucleotidyltransferase with HDIG domain